MKRKRFSALLGCLLALTMLLGLAAPFAGASDPVVITFLNPMGELEPMDDMPVASRAPLRAKLAAGEQVDILVLYYAKNGNGEINLALAQLVKETWLQQYADAYAASGNTIIITMAHGGTQIYPTREQVGNQLGWGGVTPQTTNVAPYYWKNQNHGEGKVPFHGNPWGPKTGYGHTNFPAYEEPFEKYAQWASFDAVIYGKGD